MDTSPVDRLARSVSLLLSRRALAGVLGFSSVAFPRGIAASKKRKKKKKKIKRNSFGCVDVGGFCKNAGQCCSGICQGKTGKMRCKAHDTLGCQPGSLLADCGGGSVTCPDYGEGQCATTTGKAAFCLEFKFNPVSPCRRDADCAMDGFRTACVLCGTGTTCALL